jgi:homospermidine synthase
VNPAIASGDGEKTSILVADDETLGTAAFLVVVDNNGQVVFKNSVVIGES